MFIEDDKPALSLPANKENMLWLGKKRSLRLQNNHKKQNQCFLLRALE